MRKLLPFACFLILAAMLVDALLTPKSRNDTAPVTLPNVTLQALDGTSTLTLNAMGPDVVVLNFFASWCAPCVAELPQLASLQKQHPHVKFYGVAWNDRPEVLHPWLKQHGNPFSAIWRDVDGKAAIAMGIRGIPETYIVGRDGRVRGHVAGAIEPDEARDTLGPLLRALEDEHAPQP